MYELCLYRGTYKGHEILFLRQVNDFAVGSTSNTINQDFIKAIDGHLKIDIKDLGRLTIYNGVGVTQGQHYIKLSNKTYINKVLAGHTWPESDRDIANVPLPIKSDKTYL